MTDTRTDDELVAALLDFTNDNRDHHWKVMQMKCAIAHADVAELTRRIAVLTQERDALMAEHEAVGDWWYSGATDTDKTVIVSELHDHAEEVLRGAE